MNQIYAPGVVPGNPDQLPEFLRRELTSLERSMHQPDTYLELEVLGTAPMRFRPGMIVFADGVDWNPGSGEGLYRRDAANTNWIFLG